MRTYVLRRLLIAVPSLLLATFIVFTLPRLIPGDVVQLMLEEKAYGKDLEELRAKLGLDRPIYVQYGAWLSTIAHGNFGESLWTRQSVVSELARRMPVTVTLGAMALAVALMIGVPIGVVAAIRPDGVIDFFARSAAILGLSVPAFVQAIVIILLPAIWWGWTPSVRYVEFSQDPVMHVLQFVLPSVILGVASAAAIMRLTRGMLLEVLRQDYVRTAWAKGLRERVVVLKHALKNAIIPVVTVLGLQVAQIAGGTVIIEEVFSLPGMGQLLVASIVQRDYPVIQGINLLIVGIIVATNLAVDLCYAVLDPRIRY
jgi:peptide/nickel transport system permease protein